MAAIVVDEIVTKISYQADLSGFKKADAEVKKIIRSFSRDFEKSEGRIKSSLDSIGQESVKGFSKLKRFSRSINNDFIETTKNARSLKSEIKKINAMTSKNMPKQRLKGRGSTAAGMPSFKGAGMAGGLIAGVAIIKDKVIPAFKDMVTTGAAFEQQIANLGSISRATAPELEQLSLLAKELGENTEFSASQAASGFTELSKLGFTAQQILASASSIVDLATASQTNLANASMVAASTLRQFGYDASRMREITDIMARSFTISALDINNFREAMKFVGPVARSMNVSIEETVGMLAALANQGLKGTVAATGLRRILTDIFDPASKAGGALRKMGAFTGTATDRLKALRRAGVSGIKTKKLFGRVAQTSADVLIRVSDTAKLGKESIDGLTREIMLSNGATAEMAKIQRGTLSGALKATQSKFEALKIAIFDAFAGDIKESVLGFNALLGGTIKWVKDNEKSIRGLVTVARKGFKLIELSLKPMLWYLDKMVAAYTKILGLIQDIQDVSESREQLADTEIRTGVRRVKTESDRNKILKEIGSKQADENKIITDREDLLRASSKMVAKSKGLVFGEKDFKALLSSRERLSNNEKELKLIDKQSQRFALLNILRDKSLNLTNQQRESVARQLIESTEANQQQYETTKKQIELLKNSDIVAFAELMQQLNARTEALKFSPVAALGEGFRAPQGQTSVNIKNEINFDARGQNINDPEQLERMIENKVTETQRSNTNTMLKKLRIAGAG